MSVAFSPPASNGGSPITSYTAQCVSTDGGVTGTKTGAASPLQVTGLTGGKHYHCRVRATNAIGTGAYSGYGATVLVASHGAGCADGDRFDPVGVARSSVAFSPPASNGGSPITSYTAQCVSTDGGVTEHQDRGGQPARWSPV